MIVIQEILGTDSFSGSRLTLNANFLSLETEVNDIETVFGLSLASGNIDVSTQSGGVIKGKVGAFDDIQLPAAGSPLITLAGSTGYGVMEALTLNAAGPDTLRIEAIGELHNLGSSIFDGVVTFNSTVKMLNGRIRYQLDAGDASLFVIPDTWTVLNTDDIIRVDSTLASGTLTLVADVALEDGHEVTFVKYGTTAYVLDPTLVLGATSIAFSSTAYISSITLVYSLSDAKWMIVSAVNMVIS